MSWNDSAIVDVPTDWNAAQDGAATVKISDSHKGDDHKLVELTTTLAEAQVQRMLQSFAAQHGVSVLALE